MDIHRISIVLPMISVFMCSCVETNQPTLPDTHVRSAEETVDSIQGSGIILELGDTTLIEDPEDVFYNGKAE